MNLRETITACDRLREKLEGIGLSDGLIKIIEFAYAQGQNKNYLLEIEEIARIGLELNLSGIGHELNLSDEYLIKIREHLEAKLNEEEMEEQ
tara:strand:- start:732 stop:1007 length:276 start_codon:yes stop_codon:yes gene_type:complete